MIRLLITFFGISFLMCYPGYSQEKSDEKLFWSQKKIEWSDFQGAPDTSFMTLNNDPAKAVSTIGIKFVLVENQDKCRCDQIKAVFYKHESWKVEEGADLLEHEQLHFDLMELQTRKLRKKILELIETNTDIDLDMEVQRVFDEYNQLNTRYDFETSHGTNSREQLRWQTFVDNELKKLDEYNEEILICLPQ